MSKNTTPVDLTDIDEQALVDELERRHNAMLVLLLDRLAQEDEVGSRLQSYRSGEFYTCVGMAQQWMANQRINEGGE